MCMSMGGGSSGKVEKIETVPAPEPVKRTSEEASRVRDDAQRRAAAAFGVMGTDLTRGRASQLEEKSSGKSATTGG